MAKWEEEKETKEAKERQERNLRLKESQRLRRKLDREKKKAVAKDVDANAAARNFTIIENAVMTNHAEAEQPLVDKVVLKRLSQPVAHDWPPATSDTGHLAIEDTTAKEIVNSKTGEGMNEKTNGKLTQ